ncbi:MAG: general secretion pathway protein GspB [Candidatus Sedimenticola sp. 6PFRAG7]
MSYILDALKKVEHQHTAEGPGQTGNFANVQWRAESKSRFRPALVMAGLMLSLGVLLGQGMDFGFFNATIKSSVAETTRPEPAAPTHLPAVIPEAPPALSQAEPGTEVLPDIPLDAAVETPLAYDMLPKSLRTELSGMKVDAHAYDEDPGRRFVLINTRRYKEGDILDEGPELKAIREHDVLLSYQGHQFFLSRL